MDSPWFFGFSNFKGLCVANRSNQPTKLALQDNRKESKLCRNSFPCLGLLKDL